jgi:hypothetical protein
MKRARGPPDGTSREYPAAALTDDQKDMVARVYLVWQGRDKPQDEYLSLFSEAGFVFDERSLRRWAGKARQGHTPISEEKGSGRPRSLDDVQWRILVGCVIYCNAHDVTIAPQDGQRFLWWMYKLLLHENTVRNYYMRASLSPRVLIDKTVGAKLSEEEAIATYKDDIAKWRAEGYLDGLFYCMDVFYGSRRKEQIKTWQPTGSSAMKRKEPQNKHVDAFVVMLRSDGKQECKTLVFTSDKKMAPDVRSRRFADLLRNRHISGSRVIYCPVGKAYVRENPDVIAAALDEWKLSKGSVAFTDEGNAFQKNGDSILQDRGLKHVKLTPQLHHVQSSCDHNYNRDVKVYARSKQVPFDDHELWVAELLAGCDRVKSETIRGYFKANFFLGVEKVTSAAVRALLKSDSKNAMINAPFYRKCRKEFEAAGGAAWLAEPTEVPQELRAFNEDGTKW